MKISCIDVETSFTKFENYQKINIPNNKKTNCIFIYGHNGSGKSSISKLFSVSSSCIDAEEYLQDLSQLKAKNSEIELLVKIYYDDNKVTIINDNKIENPIKIPVFNQSYIDKKITYQPNFKNNKFKENTINYGIEFPAKKSYITKLKEGKNERLKNEELQKQINKKIEASIKNIKIDTSTKDSNKNYLFFNIEEFKKISNKNIVEVNELNEQRLEHIKYIQNLKDLDENNKIQFSINYLEESSSLKEEIENINKSIEFSEDKVKTSSAREIFDNLEENKREWILGGVNYVDNNKCPFCKSDISKNDLVKVYVDYANSKINKMKVYIANEIKKINKYKNDLKNINNNIKSNIQILDKIFQLDLNVSMQKFINDLNKYFDDIINLLMVKNSEEKFFIDCSNIIESIDLKYLDEISLEYKNLIDKISNVNKKVNSSTSDRTKRNNYYLKNTAFYLTYFSIKDEIKELIESDNNIARLLKEIKPLKIAYEEELKEKNILLKKMNEILDDFNISNYRIDEDFDLCLNGEKVSFDVNKLLSNGEKSIIAFSLFISEIDLYYTENEKNIIVIDDPISSVDYPNLYGIYNYINNLIESNEKSQFILLTHNTLFMNLFKFDYSNDRASYYKFIDSDDKTKIINDNSNLDSIYLEKLKEIFLICKKNYITSTQKLCIHNYCRYVLETISRFEYPVNNNESVSSKYYLNKIINNIENKIVDYNISKVSLQSLMKIINKGSHATIDEVHDGERFEDNHYIDSCKLIISFIKAEHNGQYELLCRDYDKMTKEMNKLKIKGSENND